MVNELEKKYNTKIKTAINNNNPYTQVQDLTPKKTSLKTNVNPYNQQTEQKLKPLPKADFEPLVNQAKYTFEGGIVNPLKSLYRTATNLDDASTYSQTKFPSTEGIKEENKSYYQQQTEFDTQRYKAVKDSMESQYDYANMPENTKKAYEEVVNTLLTRQTYGKSFEEQRQVVRSLYENKEIPDFVQNKLANIDSKETEYNLNVENARQNLVKMAMDNASDVRNLELKYADKDISQATRFTTDILGSIVKMSPYIAVSAITGGVGGATLGSIAGTGTMYAQVYTGSMAKAISEGATREQATEYAHVSAMIEAGTEMLSGGIPGAPKGLLSSGIQGKIDDVVKIMVKDGTFRKFISTGVDVFGEGAEEALAEYLGSMALSIYTEDERSDEELTQDMVKAFIMGSVTSATLQMAKYGTIKVAEKFVAEKSTDVQNISLEQANDVMNRIALRTQVENFDGLSYKLEDLPKGNNGYIIDGKTIVLNRNQVEESGLIESALPHEMTHALEKVKGYDQLASFVVNLKAKTLGMDLAQLQEVYQEKFNEVHEQELANGNTSHQLEIATPDKMARELVAEFIKDNIASRPYKDAQGNIQYDTDGNIITYRNYDALLRLASNQPNMVNKIKKVIRSMIRKSQISEAIEFDQTQKADFLMMQEYLESLDGYLGTVLDNADKGLFATEQVQGLQFDTKVLSPNTEQGVKVIQAYESENEQYKGTLEDAQKLLDFSARKGLGYTEVQYEGGTLIRPSNIQLSLDQLKKNDIDVNELKNFTVEKIENKSDKYMSLSKDDLWKEHYRVLEESKAIKGKFFSKEGQEARKPFNEELARISFAMQGKNYDDMFNSYDEYIEYSSNEREKAIQEYNIIEQQRKQKEIDRINSLVKMDKKDVLMSDEDIESFIEANELDTTNDINKAIFIFGDGTMIDGGFQGGARGVDHQVLSSLFEYTTDYPKIEGVSLWGNIHLQTGVIRIVPETNVALIMQGQELTKEQQTILNESNYEIEEYLPLVEDEILVEKPKKQYSLDNSLVYQLKKNDIDVNEVKDVQLSLTPKQEFFKDVSKELLDNQGNLLTVYHGTDANFTEFDDSFFGKTDEGDLGKGFYFHKNKYNASKYAKETGKTIAVNLNIKNPLVINNQQDYRDFWKMMSENVDESKLDQEELDLFEGYMRDFYKYKELTAEEKQNILTSMGYDGVVDNTYGQIVAFYPNQIKETTNLKPTSSQDIRYSLDNSLISQLNLSTLIPLIEQSKQSASDYINSLNIQSDNPNVIKYLETMSNFVRDYNPGLRYDTIGNLTTQAQEDDFNLRENGKLKVFYLSGEPFNKDAINYGYILTSNPVGLDNPKQVYVSLRKPLYDIAEESMQEFNFVLGKDIQKVIDVFNSKGNSLVLDTDELTNAEILKAIGDELGSVDKIKEFYQTLNEVTGYDGIELTSSRQIILFNESQFGEAKVKGEYSENAKKEVKTINFKKSGTEYLVRMTNFNGVEETRALSKEDVIEVLGDDFAKVVLNATNQEQSYDVVENIISKPSNKTKQGVFSQERDDHDNQLTEEVVKFNSESSIRQKDGTLKVMYHGSPNRFEEFSYLNLGTTGAQEGIGIYFTDSPLQASQYTRNEQGMVYEVYLNIKNPTNKTKKTITKEQLKQIVLDIHNSEDNEFLYNYGDISREGLDTVANKAVNLILESNKNNVDIIDTVLIDSRIDTEQGLRIVNQYTGIDGYTLNTSDGMVSIAFFPEQIKSINNPNPTSDRRIQYSIELDSIKQQQTEQAKLNSTNNFSDARSILNDGTLTTSDSVPLESVLLNPLYNQAIINKMPTKAQKEQLQAFYLDTLARSGDTVYLELHDNDRVAYLKYPVVSDLDVVNSDIAKFYQDDSQRQEFFKDSKVRDEQGNLIPLYHGTRERFNVFEKEMIGANFNQDEIGFFFTDDLKQAKSYADYNSSGSKRYKEGYVFEVYLNIKKPLVINIDFDPIEYWDRNYKSILKKITQDKYDGIIIKAQKYDSMYIAFDSNQIKETTNLAPTLSPDIRYSIEDERIRTQKFSKSVLESNLSKQTQDTIEKQIAEGTFNSVVVADRPSIERALAEIGEDVDKAYNKFKAKIDSGLRMTKDDLVIGQLLIKKLEKSRQTEKVVSLVQDVALLGTELGQQIQALHLIKRMSAEGKLMMMQKTLTRLQDSVNSSKDRNAPRVQLEIPKEYQEFFVEVGARTQELEEQRTQLNELNQELSTQDNSDRIKELESQIAKLEEQIKSNERFTSKQNVDDILDEVKSKIAEQLPVTWKDKLDAWRYMSMLGNLRTNVRNVLGNAFVMPMTFSRDILSVGLQQFLPQEQRTRVLRASKEAENFALDDYLTVGKDIMEGTQKYDMKTDIERKRTIFKNNLLEGFREGTFKALQVGDDVFTKKHYITQMAKYLTAQNIDLNTITDEQLEKARKFAIDEAEKNTFKQGSDLANALNRIERKGGVAGTIVKAVIPFKKTPINILKMGLEYSPLGVLNGIKKIAFDIKSEKVTASQAIDTLSAGLTGTGIALLGATLYGMGFIEIGADDDETKRVYNYKNSLGRQRYSIQIGEGSYSIDWIAPAIMPFIMGAEMMRAFESDTEASLLDSLYDATLDIFDPVFELTMLQGVTDTLQSYSGSGAAMFGETLTTMGSNYINQFVPTLLGQIARTVDPIQRSTLPDAKGSLSSTLETTFRKLGNKIPFVSMMNAPVVDVKGQPISSDENPFMRAFMNLFSPGYYKTDNTTEIDQEILRLYELTENTNVLPKATPKSFQFGGETYKLGNKEYSDFGITMGEESYNLLGKLTRYDLDDETKIKVMDNLYDYAYQLAKDKYLRTQGLENDDASYKKVIEAELKGIPTLDYLIAKYAYSTMSGEDKKENFSNFLDENGFDDDLMEIVGGYKPSSSKLKTKGLKKLK